MTMKFVTCSLAFAAFAALAAGCDTRSLSPKVSTGAGNTGGNIGPGGADGGGTFVPTHKLDMLFVIDDSSEVRRSQDNLIRNFPAFMTRLMDPPGLPDLHLAVISTDMGAGNGSVASCDATGGKNGIFQYTARGACSATGLDPGATYIADSGTARNYTGNMADVFTCIAMLGEQGCGFEHQLAAMTRALGADGNPAPLENQGFLRDDAYLIIVLLTNEDDCSAPAGSPFYDTTSNPNLASPLGPPSNFRCNEFGHLCNGVKPPRLAPNGSTNDTVTLDGCVPAESAGMLIPVAELVAQIRSVKAFPDQQIVVSAITGPPTPYAVHWFGPPMTDTGPWPAMRHACTTDDGSFADPAVRITEFVRAFGANGTLLSICDTNYGPALDRIAALLSPPTMPTP